MQRRILGINSRKGERERECLAVDDTGCAPQTISGTSCGRKCVWKGRKWTERLGTTLEQRPAGWRLLWAPKVHAARLGELLCSPPALVLGLLPDSVPKSICL